MSELGEIEISGLSERDIQLLNETSRKMQPERETRKPVSQVESILQTISSRPENDTDDSTEIMSTPEKAMFDLQDILNAEKKGLEDVDEKKKIDNLAKTTEKLQLRSQVSKSEWDNLYRYVDENMHEWGQQVLESHDENTAQINQRIFGSIRNELLGRADLVDTDTRIDDGQNWSPNAEGYLDADLKFKPKKSARMLRRLHNKKELTFDHLENYYDAIAADLTKGDEVTERHREEITKSKMFLAKLRNSDEEFLEKIQNRDMDAIADLISVVRPIEYYKKHLFDKGLNRKETQRDHNDITVLTTFENKIKEAAKWDWDELVEQSTLDEKVETVEAPAMN